MGAGRGVGVVDLVGVNARWLKVINISVFSPTVYFCIILVKNLTGKGLSLNPGNRQIQLNPLPTSTFIDGGCRWDNGSICFIPSICLHCIKSREQLQQLRDVKLHSLCRSTYRTAHHDLSIAPCQDGVSETFPLSL